MKQNQCETSQESRKQNQKKDCCQTSQSSNESVAINYTFNCRTKSWGIASLCCGIASIPLVIAPYFGLPLAILAVVFHCKQKKIYPTGVSTAGLVTGIVGIVINSIMIAIVGLALLFISAFRGI